MRIDVIIVIYNVVLSGLSCVRPGWQGDACGKVIVCDNSDDALAAKNTALAARVPHVTYVGMGGNVGLSRAYNVALEHADAELVCFLDDDTPIPDDYLARVARHAKSGTSDILIPIVRADGLIYSPSRRRPLGFAPVRSLDEIDWSRGFGCINSGMTMRRSSFPACPFDESLFLDYVDHAFMRAARAACRTVEVMRDVEIGQRFSFHAHDRAAERRRFSIFARDTRAYYGRSPLGRCLGVAAIAGRGLSLVRKYGPGFLWGG